jgi:hypothetical protein
MIKYVDKIIGNILKHKNLHLDRTSLNGAGLIEVMLDEDTNNYWDMLSESSSFDKVIKNHPEATNAEILEFKKAQHILWKSRKK